MIEGGRISLRLGAIMVSWLKNAGLSKNSIVKKTIMRSNEAVSMWLVPKWYSNRLKKYYLACEGVGLTSWDALKQLGTGATDKTDIWLPPLWLLTLARPVEKRLLADLIAPNERPRPLSLRLDMIEPIRVDSSAPLRLSSTVCGRRSKEIDIETTATLENKDTLVWRAVSTFDVEEQDAYNATVPSRISLDAMRAEFSRQEIEKSMHWRFVRGGGLRYALSAEGGYGGVVSSKRVLDESWMMSVMCMELEKLERLPSREEENIPPPWCIEFRMEKVDLSSFPCVPCEGKMQWTRGARAVDWGEGSPLWCAVEAKDEQGGAMRMWAKAFPTKLKK